MKLTNKFDLPDTFVNVIMSIYKQIDGQGQEIH